jgi:hypothetical protein
MKRGRPHPVAGKRSEDAFRSCGNVFREAYLSSRRSGLFEGANSFAVHLRFCRSHAGFPGKGAAIVYRPVARNEIIDALIHIRDLYRWLKPSSEQERRARERREIGIKDLLSNLPRTKEHPTLNTVDEIADMAWLTNEGAHNLFGYDLAKIREYDLQLNGRRTHIES